MFDGLRHGMSAGATQGDVQHHYLIRGNESSDRHYKDQVPEGDKENICVGDSNTVD